MPRVAKVGVFVLACLWGQEAPAHFVLYESALERYFRILAWSGPEALGRPDTIQFLRVEGRLPEPFPNLPRLQGLYIEDIEELNLESLLQKLPKKCPHLTILAIEDCDISDLTPFRNFSLPLRGLLLDLNDFADLSPLSHLHSLEFLSIGQTSVRSLAPLVSLTSLKALDIQQTSVMDISILRQFRELRMFSAYRAVGLRDLSPLFTHQATLEFLNISFLPPAVTAPIWQNLHNFQALRVLQAQEAIPDPATLTRISQLTQLEELTIGRNSVITDLSFVRPLKNLLYLDIHSCQVKDLGPLAGHPGLIKLIIARNPISSLAPLKSCLRLTDLYCYEVPATDWEVLLDIPRLAHVMVKKTDIPADKRESLLTLLRRRGVRVDVT